MKSESAIFSDDGEKALYDKGVARLRTLDPVDRANVENMADAIVKDDRPMIQAIVCRYADRPQALDNLLEAIRSQLVDKVLGSQAGERPHEQLSSKGYEFASSYSTKQAPEGEFTMLSVSTPASRDAFHYYSTRDCEAKIS